MFFYISFLRPPPIQAAPLGTILITPQISNDLRTEPYEASQDIFYSWMPYPQANPTTTSSAIVGLKTTKPAKLTTYRNVSAYKEIPVPVPPGVREGQRWQLILSPSAGTAPLRPGYYTVDMRDPAVGNAVLPVISMPILFSAKGLKGNAKKQEKIERMYLISSLSPSTEEITHEFTPTRELKITEQTSFDLDKKIWDSGIGLSSWLVDFQQLDKNKRNWSLGIVWDALFSQEIRCMVELGAGTGIVSLTIASLRAQFSTAEHKSDEIIATDLESAIPLLKQNIDSNVSLYSHNIPEAEILDWEDGELPSSIRSLERLDVILMSDVTYNTSSFPALLKTVSKLVKLREPPIIILGYKERDEAERDVWIMLEERGIRLEKIGQRLGAAKPGVEIWFGQVVERSATMV
ncbi:hypothetical protein AGABI1DRAFT_70466 [Agaricus bisporus var. burnettii JB137-S8]|uniref:Methyltransferase-domain-containing protein n=1 Tax=Agaricus bisporus var. burnettii (strain JB137-S8 / ATCC MYA-4627 / FGSC 10392) TaxID=597362 RepID=K5W542_AGABU|nr:uncharacterized protein AGABI1DRAFT_70466 [Agaricus bisporus var. burnettii JB137-S8]EKM81929.1 hypothetical protein AGABI1DRAFT_70466 [Agaricus bisporus var. burnettii JB137-S8]